MSVYISGMEMPNNCRDCPLEDAYEGYSCRIVEKSANWGLEGRPSWCPLVPVPPHGRLIDADALIERIEFEMRHYVVKDEFDKGRVAGWNNVLRAIREYAPTIIPASEEGK